MRHHDAGHAERQETLPAQEPSHRCPTMAAARATAETAAKPDIAAISGHVPLSRSWGWNTKAKGTRKPAIPRRNASIPVAIISEPAMFAAAKAVTASGVVRSDKTA